MKALCVSVQDISRGFRRRFITLLMEGCCRRHVFPFWLSIVCLCSLFISPHFFVFFLDV